MRARRLRRASRVACLTVRSRSNMPRGANLAAASLPGKNPPFLGQCDMAWLARPCWPMVTVPACGSKSPALIAANSP